MIKFSETLVSSNPFPHAITKNVIDEEVLNCLIKEFPNYEEVQHYENVMGGRRRLSSDSALFYDFLNKNPAWKSLYERINSKNFVDELLDSYKNQLKDSGCVIDKFTFDSEFSYKKAMAPMDTVKSKVRNKGWYSLLLRVLFKTGINRFLKNLLYVAPLKMTQRYRSTKLHIHMDISSASDGYNIQPHHDSESRVAVFLIFFSHREEVGGTGGEFCIYSAKPSSDGSYPMFPSNDDLELHLAVPPTKNLMFSFLSTPNSYHSVPVMENCKGSRKFIYVAITANKTNLWRK
jgi:hypothetical protein